MKLSFLRFLALFLTVVALLTLFACTRPPTPTAKMPPTRRPSLSPSPQLMLPTPTITATPLPAPTATPLPTPTATPDPLSMVLWQQNVDPQPPATAYINIVFYASDFYNPQYGARALSLLVDLAVKLKLPVDLSFTGEALPLYLALRPDLFEKINAHPGLFAIRYHHAGPHPALLDENGFVENAAGKCVRLGGLARMQRIEIYKNYETSALNTAHWRIEDTSVYCASADATTTGSFSAVNAFAPAPYFTDDLPIFDHDLRLNVLTGLGARLVLPSDVRVTWGPGESLPAAVEGITRGWSTGHRPPVVELSLEDGDFYTTHGWAVFPLEGQQLIHSINVQNLNWRAFSETLTALIQQPGLRFISASELARWQLLQPAP